MPPRSGTHWFRVGTVDVTTTVLITGLAVISLLLFTADAHLLSPLTLDTDLVIHGQVWRLLTWPLVNSVFDGFGIVLAIFFFWYLGEFLERDLGRDRYLWFIVMVTVIPALGLTLFATVAHQPTTQPGSGMYGVETAVIVAYATAYPDARSFFGIAFWVLAAVLIGISVLSVLAARAWPLFLLLVLEIVIPMIAARSFGMTRTAWIPSVPLPAFITHDRTRKEENKRRKAAHLRVVRDTDVNALLDKIAEHGINSLTKDERERLDGHSRNRGDD